MIMIMQGVPEQLPVEALDLEELDIRFRYQEWLIAVASLKFRSRCQAVIQSNRPNLSINPVFFLALYSKSEI